MKSKIAAIATAAPLALMLTAGTALATSYAAPAEPGAPVQDQYQGGGALACVTLLGPEASPEELQAEAQAIYDADPADPNGLDADGNGLACEFSQEATGAVAFEDGSGFIEDSASPTPTEQLQDLNCVGLMDQEASPPRFQEQAQGILAEDPADPNGLDANRNGAACEFSESSTGEVAFEDGTVFAEVVDSAAPPVPEASGLSVEVSPEAPSPSADSPMFQATETSQKSPYPAPAPSEIQELPATGGPVPPALPTAPAAGTALVGTAFLALTVRRRPPGV